MWSIGGMGGIGGIGGIGGSPQRPGTGQSTRSPHDMSFNLADIPERKTTPGAEKRRTGTVKVEKVISHLDNLDHLVERPSPSLLIQEDAKANTVDFFRVCALCELKFPRDGMEIKVLRKHVVALRTTWDPLLVSKEVRLLNNTISMYSLVHVCLFCSQFFDPDFPDGIAYPTRASPLVPVQGTLGAIESQGVVARLIPHHDTRYLKPSEEVGEVFARPRTVEARARAQRALAINRKFEDRVASLAATGSL